MRKPATVDYTKEKLPEWIKDAIESHLQIEKESAQKAGAVGFMTRQLVLSTLPYRDPKKDIYDRVNGDFSLRIIAGYSGGIPYGVYPRLLMSWITTEAVKTKEREIYLGDSLASFLRDVMNIRSTGGKNGSATRINEQMKRLFGSLISAELKSNGEKKQPFRLRNIQVAEDMTLYEEEFKNLLSDNKDDASLLWLPNEQKTKWNSTVKLTENFFNECVDNPVPIDLRAYKALRGSPLAMDIYTWLTYRMSYLNKRSRPIPWEALLFQFGSNFNSERAALDFKRQFKKAFQAVKIVYPDVNVRIENKGLILLPSPTHVKKINRMPQQGDLFA